MDLRIRLPVKTDPVSIFIDASEDGREGKDLVFKEGRIIPVYYYYTGECRGYILRNEGEKYESLPNIDGAYKILLAVRGAEVGRLEKVVENLYEEVGLLEEIPPAFWTQLGILTMHRGFQPYMVKELYLVMKQKYSLLQEL